MGSHRAAHEKMQLHVLLASVMRATTRRGNKYIKQAHRIFLLLWKPCHVDLTSQERRSSVWVRLLGMRRGKYLSEGPSSSGGPGMLAKSSAAP